MKSTVYLVPFLVLLNPSGGGFFLELDKNSTIASQT